MRDREPNNEETPVRKANPGSGEPSDTERVSERNEQERRRRQMTDDERVDEASIDSFPASDPPSQP